MINHNNRPSVVRPLGALDATVTKPIFVAHKKCRVLAASYVQEGAVSVSAVNYLTFQLKVNNVAVGAAVDTQAGLAARTALAMDLNAEYIELEEGDYLSLAVSEDGTFAEGTDSILVLDVEVIGN